MLADETRRRRQRVPRRAEAAGTTAAGVAAGANNALWLEHAPDPILVADTEGRILYVNVRAAILFGYERDELIGRRIQTLVPDHAQLAFESARRAYVSAGRPLRDPAARLPFRRKDGSEFVAESSLNSVTTADGTNVLAVIRDVTSRVEVETRLRASEERFRRMIDAALEGICMIDAEGLITFVNPHLAALLGYSEQQMLRRPLIELAHEADRARLAEYLGGGRRGAHDSNEFRLERQDGQEVWVLLATTPMQEPPEPGAAPSDARSTLVMVTDLSSQKKMQARLLIADRMMSLGTLAAGVAHEINNPLAALIGNLELLSGEVSGTSAQPLTRDARDAAERVRQIVRDLKMFSRPEEDQRAAVDVRRVLESSLRMAWNEIRHRARLVKDYQQVPLIEANEGRLGQVFLNLIINAAQAIPEGHADENEIRIVTRVAADGRVVVEVRDSGGGISPDILMRIFDPFFTTKPIGVGTGLGLSICQRIVSDVGGDLWVETVVGKGSVFAVALPPFTADAVDPPAERSAPIPCPRRGRILVVDDEPLVRALIERALGREHDVVVESRAEQALARIREGARFDLILCDVMMPQMTGIDLREALREVAPDQAPRVVFITGGAFTGRAREYLESTHAATIEKPFEMRKLRALVTERLRG